MLKLHLIILLVLGLTIQTCIKGCLKCTTDNKCLLCDTTSNYKLENDSCTLVDHPNCAHINVNGDCLGCSDGYWMNTTTKKCVVVETEKKVVNCMSYTSSQICRECEPHFVIEAAKCKAVEVQLENCVVYKSLTSCGECKKGFFVSSDEKSCESVPSVSNCAFLSRYQCDACASGFILNQNLYFENSFKTASTLEKEESLANVLMSKTGLKMLINRPVCQETTVKYCSAYESFNLCKTCMPGYFITEEKSCQAFPKSVILNCTIYSSNTTCLECNQGFYLSSSTECKIVASVENCSEYSQISNTTQCTGCGSEFYLASPTSCSTRNISALSKITNCKTKSHNSDKCLICNTNSVLSSGGDECAAEITNCDTHNAFTAGNTPTCSKCVNGFYLDNNVCKSGTDTNCEVFASGGTCSQCKNTFYHVGVEGCEAHLTNANCLTYSDSVKNSCVECENETFNFLIANRCKILTPIDKCVIYNHLADASVAKCGTCENGYYEAVDGFSCVKIQGINCAKVVNTEPGVCTECEDGFNLFVYAGPVTECKNPHEYLTEQCNTFTNPGTNQINTFTCNDCKTGALTINYEKNFACINDEYLKETSIGIVTVIPGCIKYNGTLCVMCNSTTYLQTNQLSCLENCGSDTQFYPFKITNGGSGDNYWINLYNYCGSGSTDKIIAKYPDNTNVYVTISCADTLMPVVDTSLTVAVAQKYSNVSLDGSFGNWVQDIRTINPELSSCIALGGATTLEDSSTALTSNCEYYGLTTSTIYGCLRCSHRFSSKASGDDSKVLATGGCSTMNSCSSEKYGNIPTYWAKFFSCHQCSGADEIPFLFYKFATAGSDISFRSYDTFDLKNTGDWVDADVNKTVECLNNKTLASVQTQLGKNDIAFTFVEFCGLGLFDLNATKANFDNSAAATAGYASSTYCAACKPGYKPDTARDPHTVLGCTKIDNCANSTWFNACSECDDSFVFDYDGSNGVDYTTCVANTDDNCFSAAASAKCTLCKKGYSKNADGICIMINTPQCQNNKFVPRLEVDTDSFNDDLGYLMWYNEKGAGCNQCNSGYTAVLYSSGNYPNLSCAASNYVATNATNFPNDPTGASSAYINNCSIYKVDASLIECTKCSGNFVLRKNGSECISVLNCVKAIDGSSVGCHECAAGYGLTIGGGCVVGNTANCATYYTSTANSTARCESCNEGYFKTETNICEEGAVANCLTHGNTAKKCITCKSGYFLIQNNLLNGDYDYCFKFDDSLNCSAVAITNESNAGARFSCTTCTVENSILETPLDTENKTNCLSFNLIENCDTYNVGPDLNNSSFSCSVCKAGFFTTIDGFKCVKREISPAGCKTYQNDEDLCSECNEGNFLSTNKKECSPFPTGVIGCLIYSNATTCIACGNDSWLNDGVCTNVLEDAKVTNCIQYSNASTCSTCEPNFIIEGNTCVALNVSNCLTIASKDACETCKPDHRLKTENGKTNCESYTKPNCKTFDQSGTNQCKECNQNFYINTEGECAAASPLIANCLTNSTIDTCKTCSSKFALSKDKKTCISALVYDNNCTTVTMPENMSCSQCNPGHYFKNGACVAFLEKTFENGCFSQDLMDDKVCIMCNSGFYMNSALNCVEIEKKAETGGDVVVIEGVRLMGLLVVGLLFLF